MWNQWSQYAVVQPPLPMAAAPPPPPSEPIQSAPPPPGGAPQQPVLIGPVAPVPPGGAATPSTAASAAIPNSASTNPYSQYTAAQYAALTPEQQYTIQQHWQQWQKYQEEYAKWHAQYGEQYKREMEAAATTTTAAYPSFTGPVPPQVDPKTAASTTKITGQPQLYNQPPPQIGPPNQYMTTAPPSTPMPHQQHAQAQQQPPPPPPPSQQSQTSFQQQQPPAQWQSNQSFFNQPPPNFNSPSGPPNNFQNANNQNVNQPNQWNSAPPSFGNQRSLQPPPIDSFRSNERGNNGPPGGFNNSGPSNWNTGPSNNRESFGPDNMNRGRVGPNNDNDQYGRRPGQLTANPEDKWNEGSSNKANKESNDMPPFVSNNRGGNSGPNDWQQGPPNSRGRSSAGPNDWRSDSRNSNNDDPEDWDSNRTNVRNRSNERDDWKAGAPSNRGVNNDGPWQSGANNRGNNNRFNEWNNGPPNNSRDGNSFNDWNDGPNSRARRDGSNDWREGRDNNDRNIRNQDINSRGNFNSKDDDSGGGSERGRDRDFGSNNSNNRFGGGGSGGWNDGPNSGRNNRSNEWENRGNNRPNNWGDNRGPNNWSDGPNNQGNNWNNGPNNNRGPSTSQNQQQMAVRSSVPDIDEEKFDRQFKQWEEQFEDWKRANANHPDREMYRRYEQEFEKQRSRITERREQMRRRKLERMGLDPNQPPPAVTNSGNNSIVGSETECKNTSRDSSRNRDLSGNRNPPGRKNSFNEINLLVNPHNAGEQKSPDDDKEDIETDIKDAEDEEPEDDEVPIADGDKNQNSQSNQNKRVERKEEIRDENETASKVKSNAPISIKFNLQKNTPLGKRKSRFDTSGPPVNKLKPLPGKGNIAEVINLDDDDDEDLDERNQSNIPNENMAEIFKKTDGIPGLDLVEVGPLSAVHGEVTDSEVKTDANKQSHTKKIPSLFDIKVDKPDMGGKADTKDTDAGGPIPDISKTLNDPEFMKKISEAVAKAQGKDERQPQEDMRDASERPLSFAEWQRHQQQNEMPSNFDDNDNSNSNDNNPTSDRISTSKSILEDDLSNASCGERSSMVEEEPNMVSLGPNDGRNNMGPNDNNFGPNGPNGQGPNNGPNNWGPNNWRPGGGPNNWGNNSGPNNWGPNGGGGGPNNNWGPNNGGPNNWGNNGGGGGPNNWDNNSGPNNWGPNNNNGPNNNRGGPNNNWGPNNGGPNNWGNNGGGGGSGGPNNWGRNNNNFGPNFRGNNNNRNFGPNGPNFGPNGPNGPNIGPNGPNAPNIGPNGPNGPNFGSNFGPNGPNSPNFGPKGPNNNMGRNSPNVGPNNRIFGPNNGPKFGNNTPGRNFGRDGPQNQPDDTDSAQTQRNVNNPFRRSETSNIALSADSDVNSPKPWMKGPGDNLDYGDYFRPVQVIDYTNNANAVAPKVFDYGHRPVVNNDDFKPVKVINYDHAPKSGNKAAPTTTLTEQRQRRGQNRRTRRKQQREEQQLKKQQMSQNQNNANEQQEDNVGPSNARENEEQLEDISDTEDVHEEMMEEEQRESSPAPPPPPMYSFGSGCRSGAAMMQPQPVPLSIFPSTAQANENCTKMTVDHVQMSIPTVENNNTISIEEILMQPGRDTRPKKICIILRGPPGSGKSHVAKLIKEKEKEMSGNNPRVLSIDDYFLIENDYEEKCKKTGKKIPKKEILYEYDKDMEETYMQYLIKSFKKTIVDNFYDFIVIDCNNNSLRTLNEFYCHSKDSGYVPYIIDLFCDLETCMDHNIHERTESDIKQIINTWKPTPFHYIKLDVSSLLQNVVEMEDAEDMHVDDNVVSENADALSQTADEYDKETASAADDEDKHFDDAQGDNDYDDDEVAEDDSNDSAENQCGFLKSKWETDTTTVNLARLDGTSKLNSKRKQTMEEYLQMDEWQPVPTSSKGKKRVRWADIEEKREQEKMRAVGFVVGQTDWKRMMDPNAAKRALNKTKYIERVNKQRR